MLTWFRILDLGASENLNPLLELTFRVFEFLPS